VVDLTGLGVDGIWDYRAGVTLADRSLVGFSVEATDGHIGEIAASSIVVGQAHILVETGSWILGKKRMIPAGVIERIDVHETTVHVGMSREQIKRAPDFDPAQPIDREECDEYYQRFLPAPA
jgi:hypothetical protein